MFGYADYSADLRNLLVCNELSPFQKSDYSLDLRNSKWRKEMWPRGPFLPCGIGRALHSSAFSRVSLGESKPFAERKATLVFWSTPTSGLLDAIMMIWRQQQGLIAATPEDQVEVVAEPDVAGPRPQARRLPWLVHSRALFNPIEIRYSGKILAQSTNLLKPKSP